MMMVLRKEARADGREVSSRGQTIANICNPGLHMVALILGDELAITGNLGDGPFAWIFSCLFSCTR